MTKPDAVPVVDAGEAVSIVRALAELWPVQADGLCRYCAHVVPVPGPASAPDYAVSALLGPGWHQASCVWARARRACGAL